MYITPKSHVLWVHHLLMWLFTVVTGPCAYSDKTPCECVLISQLGLSQGSHKQLVYLGLNTQTAGSTGIIVPDRSEVEFCVLYLYVLRFLKAVTANSLIQASNNFVPHFSIFKTDIFHINTSLGIPNSQCGKAT